MLTFILGILVGILLFFAFVFSIGAYAFHSPTMGKRVVSSVMRHVMNAKVKE